ncbi:transforming growth factor-beta receptor-associated protein 1-like isoform X2 [Oratosquilla oratoria]|uniref:transforming growth factor-beta receptor-associated protein 1-like isoform X2 n=1 Tax=Oratosquilla oratoria TaxID=337810 RepID=UPI003F772351
MSLRAFELVPVVERTENKIECLEASGNDLYIGSEDGMVLHYSVEERSRQPCGTLFYSTNTLGVKNLGTKKPVIQLKTASALTRVLALSDGNLYLLDSESLNTVGSGPKIKNVIVFCINENPNTLDPFTIQFCVGKRRSVQMCSLHEDRVSLFKEVSTIDSPVSLAMDGSFVCVAGQCQYSVYNVQTGSVQDLFPYDPTTTFPHVKRIAKEEFLLVGPGSLGMFVTAAGISERPPIQWTDDILAVTYYHPYILTVTSEFIRVYSLIDQQQKQTVNFSTGRLLENFDGQIYVSSQYSIFCLLPQPWTKQVQALIENERVEEALELANHSRAAGMSQEQYEVFMATLLQKAGFIKLAYGVYDQAQEYFFKGKIDIRELISLYPGMMPSKANFIRTQPPLHNMADIIQATHGDQEKLSQAKQFLFNYLMFLRSSGEPIPHRVEVDTAIIKLYAEEKSVDLIAFLEGGDVVCAMQECVQWLEKYGQFTALAKVYRIMGDMEKALGVLTQLVRGEISDENFTGLQQLVDTLTCVTDASIVWRYADFVLEHDAVQGVRVFIESAASLNPTEVLETLHRYPDARLKYLHHLIYSKKFKDEKYHTELILHYVEEAVKQSDEESSSLEETREKLLDLLCSSCHYQPKLVLSRLVNTNLHQETAYVYGKLEEHEKALSLLVHKMKDFSAAEQYCITHTKGKEEKVKSKIFLTLLKIYLRPPSGGSSDDIELAPAIELLSLHAGDLDLEAVLELLPEHWSLTIFQHYLRAAIRASMHQSRIKRIQQTLVRCENLQQKYVLHKLSRDMGPIPMSGSRICCVCGKRFSECAFTIYPNGVMAHIGCASDPHVCPLTGTVFKVSKTC